MSKLHQWASNIPAGVILEIEDLATELSSLHNQLTTENADAANSRFRILETQITHLEARIHAVTQPIPIILPRSSVQIYRRHFGAAANNKGTPFEPARMPFSATESGKEIAWFDELFRGGLCVPTRGSRPLTVLVAGPPGGGKTTLVLELCYRLAKNEAHSSRGLFPLYLGESRLRPADRERDAAGLPARFVSTFSTIRLARKTNIGAG